jgi:hypothetical protein
VTTILERLVAPGFIMSGKANAMNDTTITVTWAPPKRGRDPFAPDKGWHWTVSRDGATKSSVGEIHDVDLALAEAGAAYKALLQRAETERQQAARAAVAAKQRKTAATQQRKVAQKA